MANRFDIDAAPDGQAPETIIIGDYLLWKRTDLVSDYPLATHSMEYVARITAGGNTEIKVAATETNGTYVFEVEQRDQCNRLCCWLLSLAARSH